jgi:hypothetical protein
MFWPLIVRVDKLETRKTDKDKRKHKTALRQRATRVIRTLIAGISSFQQNIPVDNTPTSLYLVV